MSRSFELLYQGLTVTAQVAVGGLILAAVLGLIVGLGAASQRRWLRYPARVHIEVFRGTSALVQMFWFFYVLPSLFAISLSPLTAGIVVLGLNISAYLGEVVRGALLAVPKGQREAACALGLSPVQTLWRVTLPQAIPSMIPPWGNLTIELTKGSALVTFISVHDLMFQGSILRSESPGNALSIYFWIGVAYGLLCLFLLIPAKLLERVAIQRACGTAVLFCAWPIARGYYAIMRIPARGWQILAAVALLVFLMIEWNSGSVQTTVSTAMASFRNQWDHAFALRILPQLTQQALVVTLICTALGGALAITLGLVWAGLRTIPYVGTISFWLLECIRTTPLLVQLFLLAYGVLPALGLNVQPLVVGIVTLGVHYSTYTAEVYRAGINGVPNGQREAALALGLGPIATFIRIIIPQAVPRVIPALGNYLVALLKETPLLSAITVVELLRTAREIVAVEFRSVEAFTIVGILFLLISLLAAALIRLSERFLPVRHA